MWMAHHSIFRIIRRTSGRLMLANGLLLLVIVLVPFPTKTMGEFINTPARDTAVQFYTGYFILVSITFNLLIWVVSRNRDILSLGVTRQQTRRLQLLQLRGLFFNGLIFAVAFFNAWVALAMSIATWVFWAILIRD